MENKSDKKKNLWQELKFINNYIKQDKKSFVLFFTGWHIEAALNLLLPILLGRLIDEMVYYKNIGNFFKISGLILVIALFLCSLYFFIYMFYNYNYGKYAFHIKMDLFDHLLKAKVQAVEKNKNGEVINMINNYTDECITIVNRNLIYTFYCIFVIVFYVVYIFFINRYIGLWLTLFVSISTVITLTTTNKVRSYSDTEKKINGTYRGWLLEMINGIKDLRLLQAEKKTLKDFRDYNKELLHLGFRKRLFLQLQQNITGATNLILQMLIFYIGAVFTIRGDITVGVFTVIVAFYNEIKQNILYLNSYHIDLQDRAGYVKYIREFFEVETEEDLWTEKNVGTENNAPSETKELRSGKIQFDNLEFSYGEETEILKNLTLHIEDKEHIAIVGKSGCGKTTLMNLLVGFLKPSSGKICIDGCSLEEVPLKVLRRWVGYVQQKNYIFNGTIRYNLTLGDQHASEEKIREACKKAKIIDFIEGLEKGFDTVLGDVGLQVSGGQAQRLSIARIYIKNPPIIIYDESTSALDKEMEAAIHDSWDMFQDKTILVISHKASSVMRCEKIAVMQNGRIMEVGQTENVMKNNDYCRTLFSIN